jgi:hypothetical protein
MACPTTTNPAQISITSNTTLHIFCVSHAGFFQQVTLSFNQDMSNNIGTFSGTGENVAMALADGKNVLTAKTGNNKTLFAQFRFSKSGPNGPFRPAVSVCAPIVNGTPPNPVFTTVTSEDSGDDDNNDSYLTVADLNSAQKQIGKSDATYASA